MAKRGRPKSDVETTLIRVERGTAHKIKVTATLRGVSVAKLFETRLKPTIDKEHAAALRDASGDGKR